MNELDIKRLRREAELDLEALKTSGSDAVP